MADDTSKRIIPDQMQYEILPAVAADPLRIARTHGTVHHGAFLKGIRSRGPVMYEPAPPVRADMTALTVVRKMPLWRTSRVQ
jgi:hypothetical protein